MYSKCIENLAYSQHINYYPLGRSLDYCDIFLKVLSAFALAHPPTSTVYLTCKPERICWYIQILSLLCSKPSRAPRLRGKLKSYSGQQCPTPSSCLSHYLSEQDS